MSNEVKSALAEITGINKEIFLRVAELKKLRERKVVLEETIKDYIDKKEIPGVKSGNIQVVLDSKTKRERKKKEEKVKDMLQLLGRAGVSNPERLMREIDEIQKGSEVTVKKLKIIGGTK